MRALDEAPFVDVFSPDFDDDPARFVDDLRRRSGIVRTPIGAMAIRRDLVQVLLSDRRLRSAVPDIVRMQGVTDGPIHELVGDSLLANEGAEHARIRKLVNRSFTPRAVDAHRPAMRGILDALLAPLAERGARGHRGRRLPRPDRHPGRAVAHRREPRPGDVRAARDFDITAVRDPHHTFGGGPHYCLGANLARAEMQEALLRLTALMPTFALDGEPTWRSPMGIYGPETLPLRFGS